MPKLAWPAFVFLAVLLAGTLVVVPYLPTNDGPEWVYASHIENHYADANAPYPAAYVPALQFASRGFTLLYDVLEDALGWQRGLQVALILVVLLVAGSFAAFVHALDPRRWALGFLGFPLALSWGLYMGFWAFVVATGLGFLVLTLALRLGRASGRGSAILSLFLLVQAVAHVFAAVLTGGALLSLRVAQAPRGERLREAGRVALVGLPAAGILAASVAASGSATGLAFQQGFFRLRLLDALAIYPRTVLPGPLWRALLVTIAIAAAVVVAVVRAPRGDTEAQDRGLGSYAAVLFVASLVLPLDVPGWQYFSQRFIPFGAALALAVVPIERLPAAARRLTAPLLFALASASLALSYPFHLRLGALCRDALAGARAPVRRTAQQLPITLEIAEGGPYDPVRAEVPLMSPLLHMGALYAAAQGGLSPFGFSSSPATYPFTTRVTAAARPPIPNLEAYWGALDSGMLDRDPTFRRQFDDEIAMFGTYYEGVAVMGATPEDERVWLARGYAIDWEQGTTFLAHFVPCSIDLTLPRGTVEAPPSFDARVGKFAFVKGEHLPSRLGSDGLAHFLVARSPCGAVTLRVRRDERDDGSSLCPAAGASGEIVANVTRESNRIDCAGPPSP